MKKFSIIIFVFLFACLAGAKDVNNNFTFFMGQCCLALQPAPLPVTPHQLVVIAHRGSHINVPENTLAAYENAIKEGADYVEIDLRTTKDGHLVIMHNQSVTKMTGKEAFVKDLSYSEINDLKIKPVSEKDTTTYRVPDFASVLNVCKGRINIYLDFKDADVEKAYKLIKEAGMQNNIVVYLNKEEQYGQWKKFAPHVPLMASLPEKMNDVQLNNFLDKVHLDVVDNADTEDRVRLMHKRKIAVWLDVQSKDEGPEKWEQALKEGIDGLQTDHPAKLVKYLEERRIR